MRLSKIKLSGFKSFVDPTTISFPSNLMGIVGPNGCGKSNIIDAIRWVLGEGSAKTLRGESMADVIFNGSGGRKPVGQASIELIFDNSDGTLSGPYAGYSEVAIRRVVSRDGTSQYFLNGARCRRKDITHILLGTGLGSHGYSIIEQGMISRLVEAKPEDLRAFLEEAAGISKYKERRRETEHRIRHTRENLDRLSDLREEVDKQLSHLQRQARAAKRYKSLKEEQRRLEAELLALRLIGLNRETRAQESNLNQQQTELDAAIASQRSIEAALEKLRVEQTERNDRFNDVQGGYYKVGAEIARLEQSIQHRKDLGQRQKEDLQATDEHLGELKSHIESDQVELEEIERLLRELSPGLEQAHLSQEAALEALRQAEEATESWRERWDQAASELAETERAREVADARLEHLTAQRDRLQRQREKLEKERGTLSTAELEAHLEKLIANEETLDGECQEATRVLEGVWAQIQTFRSQDSDVSARLDQARSQLQSDRGRLASLEALQEAALGKTSEQVSSWLDARNLSSSPRLAQSLTVQPGWERAVETVLGAYLQAVCVDSINEVAESLTDLTDGGLTLLDNTVDLQPAGQQRGKMLRNYVTGRAVETLFQDVHAADSLQEAVRLRKKLARRESVVTRDGFWLGPDWLRINRSDDPRVGVLARTDEINRLSGEVASGARQVEEIEEALVDTRSQLDELEETRANVQLEVSERQQLYAETKSQLETTRTRLEQLQSQMAALGQSMLDVDAEARSLAAEIEDCGARVKAADAQYEELEEGRAQLTDSRSHYRERLEDARARAEQDRELAQDIAIKVESRRSSKESARAALERVHAQQEHLLKRRRELEAQLETATGPLGAEEQALAAGLDERLIVEQSLSAARRAMEVVDARLRDTEAERSEQERRVSAAREVADKSRLGVRETQVRAETVAEQFAHTGFDLEALSAGFPEDASSDQWEESVEKIERRIQRLGPINLAAIDEFKEYSERKEYLDSQYKDLSEALDTLDNAIRKIDRETRTRFKETFDRANSGLGRLFPRLFGGGHGYLELEGDDLLTCGVTVMARPPGKRISIIHLLSGGEKALTAVALVFSIFELNPAPFCLLDEVDAPLDDANIGRFSEIVKEMSQQIQFVLITHNKATMEIMHQLTGVTMHEPGVSRLVAVDIDEAVQLAAV